MRPEAVPQICAKPSREAPLRPRVFARPLPACLLLWLLPILAAAETAYVTDNLRLGLHQAQDTSDRAFRTLESGQELEILGRDRNYAQVRLPDGTVGYVKVAYLVFDKPAKLIVAETQADLERLRAELDKTKKDFQTPAATIAALEEQVAAGKAALEESEEKLADLTASNENYRERHDKFKYSLPFTWVGGAMGLCLLAGLLAGFWWTDYRSRKRHGGVRIY